MPKGGSRSWWARALENRLAQFTGPTMAARAGPRIISYSPWISRSLCYIRNGLLPGTTRPGLQWQGWFNLASVGYQSKSLIGLDHYCRLSTLCLVIRHLGRWTKPIWSLSSVIAKNEHHPHLVVGCNRSCFGEEVPYISVEDRAGSLYSQSEWIEFCLLGSRSTAIPIGMASTKLHFFGRPTLHKWTSMKSSEHPVICHCPKWTSGVLVHRVICHTPWT